MFPTMPNIDPMTLAALYRAQSGGIGGIGAPPNLAPQMPALATPQPRMGGGMPMGGQPGMPPTMPASGIGAMARSPQQMMQLAQMMKGINAPPPGVNQQAGGDGPFPQNYGGLNTPQPGAMGGGGNLAGLLAMFGGGGGAAGGGYPGLGGQ